ncbi:MAG: FISUMP domain-containing protein [bacterium]
MKKDVFISHSIVDKSIADKVCSMFEESEISCWIAPRDISPGKDWDEAILDGIDETDALVLILSEASNISRFVQAEVNRAFSKHKGIFALRITDIEPSRMLELYLARTQRHDGFPPPVEPKLNSLVSAVLNWKNNIITSSKHVEKNLPKEKSLPKEKTLSKEKSLNKVKATEISSVKIGTQIWMKENLNVDRFRNGDQIPEVKGNKEWEKAVNNKQPAWCYYENDPANGKIYGKLYNWYAVNDKRGLEPDGWHIPSDKEWTALTDFFGGEKVAGGKMKSTGTQYWLSPNKAATNESDFSGLPGGCRYYFRGFDYIGSNGYWWSSTYNYAGYRYLLYRDGVVYRDDGSKENGFSVRCLRD